MPPNVPDSIGPEKPPGPTMLATAARKAVGVCCSRRRSAVRHRSTIPVVGLGDKVSLKPGDFVECTRKYGLEDVKQFARLSGDANPIHLDESVAAKTRFGRRVVHGMLYSSMFSKLFGSHLPGSIYVEQVLKFKAPVFIDDTVTAKVTIQEVNTATKKVTCLTTCTNQDDKIVVDGMAVVLIPTIV